MSFTVDHYGHVTIEAAHAALRELYVLPDVPAAPESLIEEVA